MKPRRLDGSLAPDPAQLRREAEARETHDWTVDLVSKRFQEGLLKVFDDVFVGDRFVRFLHRADPIYLTLLQGMGDVVASRALVGHWMVAHTLATQTRFWLEDVIIDILLKRPPVADEPKPEIYSLRMLADAWHISGRSLWNVGENWREELHGRGAWRPLIQERALDAIERIVGEEERLYEALTRIERRDLRPDSPIARRTDERALTRAADSLGGAASAISVRCNLLILEPESSGIEPHIWAVRFINPTTFGAASAVKAERVNLLRIRAWLAQEKPFRAPGHIQVAIADFVPRHEREDAGGRIAAHFSTLTRWSADQFWDFLRVPFAAVSAGIRDAGTAMQERLVSGLGSLQLGAKEGGHRSAR